MSRSLQGFAMKCALRFKVLKPAAAAENGTGWTVQVGSGEVTFESDHRFRAGALIELSIPWPVQLNGNCPLQLVVRGHVNRVQGCLAACDVDRYEFRTVARSRAAAAGTWNIMQQEQFSPRLTTHTDPLRVGSALADKTRRDHCHDSFDSQSPCY